MKLVKINDIILNMNNVVAIKGEDSCSDDDVNVYAYTESDRIFLGVCKSRQDYKELIDAVYANFGNAFAGEIFDEDENEKELWS